MAVFAAVLISGVVLGAVKFKKFVRPNSSEANPFDNILANMSADEILKPDFDKLDINNAGADEQAYKTCSHAGYGFSFECPADWSTDLFKDEGGEVAVVQNSETAILIYIYPFDEPGPITKERILRDVPDMKMANGRQIKIAGAIDGLSFDSGEREMGPTKEIWFVYNKSNFPAPPRAGSF